MQKKRLPIGVDSFDKIIKNNFYYVDKTGFIKEILQNLGEVNLFTRPRRFGKSLNMSMLKAFFEIGTDKSLFDGLAIAGEQDLCEQYMAQYPVIALSLKDDRGLEFSVAKTKLYDNIKNEIYRHVKMMDINKLSNIEQNILNSLLNKTDNFERSLLDLSSILNSYYQKKVIFLIDEYDVPLQKAELKGYYTEMTELISALFSASMKSNPYLEFAIVTGCLRISKESIFTGFNNPKVHTVLDEQYDEWFGFTDAEVREILAYYGVSEHYELTKEWYNGYMFGVTKVYNPWDVLNWCEQLAKTSDRRPKEFWANTSGNDVIKRFAEIADDDTRAEIASLLEGRSVYKELSMNLTYAELDKTVENLWSVLVMTGYLTYASVNAEGKYELVIPNFEVRSILKKLLEEWFSERIQQDDEGLEYFFKAVDSGDASSMQNYLNAVLLECISFYDGGNLEEKETFYQGFLLGLLKTRKGWSVKSNREAGHGRLDIVLEPRMRQTAVIFELKYADSVEELYGEAERALIQVQERDYDAYFEPFKRSKIMHYGIAFYKKRCVVVGEIVE